MRVARTIPPAAAPIYLREILAGLKGVMRGQKELDRFESELKEYFDTKHCFLVSSGKTALTVILQALKAIHPERDEVLIPAFTCYSVPSAIVRAGLKVKLCDIDPDTLDFDYSQLQELLCKQSLDGCSRRGRLLAIIPSHLFGISSDVARLKALADDPGVTIIEDAAQSMGGEWKGRKLGTLGDVSFFSLGRGKAVSTVEGGIIVTSRDDVAAGIKPLIEMLPGYGPMSLLKLLGGAIALAVLLRPSLFWLPKSLPFLGLGKTVYDPDFARRRMSPMQAGMARNWKSKISILGKCRSENVAELAGHLGNGFSLPCRSSDGHTPALIRFPVKVTDTALRGEILMAGEKSGLGIMPSYPGSIDQIPELAGHFPGQSFPGATISASTLLTLPVHSLLNSGDKSRLAACLRMLEQGRTGSLHEGRDRA